MRESAPGVRDTQFRCGESQNCKRRRMFFRYNLRRARQGRRRRMANAFMQEAIERAVENVRSGRGGPFAAVVVKEGRIIAAGANCVTSTNDPPAHAEVTALREACPLLATFEVPGGEI